jgi:electron transport complex protein RnfC
MYNKNERISIQQIPTKYTSGTEKLLIKALLDIEIPSGGYAADVGVLCQNVATTKAIFDAVVDSKPLVSRIVTITGSGVAKPNNYEVRLGATFDHIISMSQPNNNSHTMRMGGMMMGIDVEDINAPICKITNCIFVNNKSKPILVQECIRCGACSDVCPVDLLPQQLYWYSKNEDIDKAMDYNLIDCIECRCCDYVCPSQIPLAEYFAFSKALHRKQVIEKEHIDLSRERFEYREYRLERNKKEKAEMMAAKKEELKKKMANDKAQKDKIAAAMARVNNKKANNKDA